MGILTPTKTVFRPTYVPTWIVFNFSATPQLTLPDVNARLVSDFVARGAVERPSLLKIALDVYREWALDMYPRKLSQPSFELGEDLALACVAKAMTKVNPAASLTPVVYSNINYMVNSASDIIRIFTEIISRQDAMTQTVLYNTYEIDGKSSSVFVTQGPLPSVCLSNVATRIIQVSNTESADVLVTNFDMPFEEFAEHIAQRI